MGKTLTDKELESLAKGCLVAIVVPIMLAVRAAIVGTILWYVVPFWLAYAHQPNRWLFWHGALIGLVPIASKTVNGFVVLAGLATFIASFFLLGQ